MRDPLSDPLDTSAAMAHLLPLPVVGGLVRRFGRVEHPPTMGPYHTLVKAIVGQQLSNKAARAIWLRLLGAFGGDLPDPAVLSLASDEALRSVGLSRPKAAYVRELAGHFAAGRLKPDELARMPEGAVVESLTAVKGIGRWSADMFLIFGLNRPDVLPVGDLGIRKAVMRGFALGALPGENELLDIAEPWKPWRTVASWYLWRSLEGE